MNGLLWTVAIGVAFGLIQGAHDYWFNDGWADRANKEAAEKGLPEATHVKRKWGRVVSVMSVDENGHWLWKAFRP